MSSQPDVHNTSVSSSVVDPAPGLTHYAVAAARAFFGVPYFEVETATAAWAEIVKFLRV